jgi:hypothetical protein
MFPLVRHFSVPNFSALLFVRPFRVFRGLSFRPLLVPRFRPRSPFGLPVVAFAPIRAPVYNAGMSKRQKPSSR